MNLKKLLLTSIIIIILLTCISSANAGFLDGLFGQQQNNITNISNLEFNIPDGYVLNDKADNYVEDIGWYLDFYGSTAKAEIINDDYSKVPDNAEIVNESSMNYINKESNDTISIDIKHPFNGTQQPKLEENELNKNISGIEGHFKEIDKDRVYFTYNKDGSLIEIYAPNEDLISNIIVNENK